MRRFPYLKQLNAIDCGPTCIRMIARFYGKDIPIKSIQEVAGITREGVPLLGLIHATESIGFKTKAVNITISQLFQHAFLPCILHWGQNHFVVVHKITKKKIYVADPAFGKMTFTRENFINASRENNHNSEKCIVLFMEPTERFNNYIPKKEKRLKLRFLSKYLSEYKKQFLILIGYLICGSLINLVLPFLTQEIVDSGINNKDFELIFLILIAQMALFIGRIAIDYSRSWILLKISTKINVSLALNFLKKLTRLHLKFFDNRPIGDITQRMSDTQRIDQFLTSQTLDVLFSIINFIVFGVILATYSWLIFLLFLIGSFLFGGWQLLFLDKRKSLDYQYFDNQAKRNSLLWQFITGIADVKLNNYEKQQTSKWEKLQDTKYDINVSRLKLNQIQFSGALFINEAKNIIITFIAATGVIKGDLSLGMMLSIQYIIGQLNGPLTQLSNFMYQAQDAKLSLSRLNEVYNEKSEIEIKSKIIGAPAISNKLFFKAAAFKYSKFSSLVLRNINLEIPANKVTAIVGSSGSGKTTLTKLILGFYNPTEGRVFIDNNDLSNMEIQSWRHSCGAVLQDGYFFSDSIENNIVMGQDIDLEWMQQAAKIANATNFIEELPLKYDTKIGMDGIGLSQGQKQRLLIARAIYKKPQLLVLDEATNALDAKNEKVIIENLEQYYKNRTVIVVAHRLSTVRHADKIVVLNNGEIAEEGTHFELTNKRGIYYNLVKNQLELGD